VKYGLNHVTYLIEQVCVCQCGCFLLIVISDRLIAEWCLWQ
jgi:hypothetical protein